MPDLTTSYLDLKLKSPLVASSSPLCKSVDNLCRLEDAGASAIVLHSLFEEQINLESHELDRWLEPNEGFAEAQSYLPDLTSYNIGPEALRGAYRQRQKVGANSGDRQPERCVFGWLDPLREADRAGGRGCA